MLSLKLPCDTNAPLKILCLGSHSDDIEIGCGGTVLQLLSRGIKMEVEWVVLSSNKEREQEARKGADLFLGPASQRKIIVKHFRDGFFPFDAARLKQFFEGLKGVSPDLILTHNRKDAHQDHRLVGELTWNTFRDHWILEYEIPKYDGDMGKPSVFVKLDSHVCQRKVDYILDAFPSQHAKRWFQRETFVSLMRLRGMECNSPSGYAEAFYCSKLAF